MIKKPFFFICHSTFVIRHLLIVLALFTSSVASSQDPVLTRFEKIRSDSQFKNQLEQVVDSAIRNVFGERTSKPAFFDPLFQDPLPLFVTAKKGEEVRGCMGTLKPKKSSLSEEIAENLKLAFTKDPQHSPIRPDEVGGMEIFVTAVGTPIPVSKIGSLSPARDGILIRGGSKEAVVLPGEAKTLRYLLAFAKSKAGIKRGEGFQLYRLPSSTVTVKVGNEVFSPRSKEGETLKSNPR